MKSKMLKFEKWLKGRVCPGCGAERLVPRMPSNVSQIRCMNCGALSHRKVEN